MDDDLEDEILMQTFVTHVRFMTRIITSISGSLAAVDVVLRRHLIVYLLKPETIACCLMTLVLFSYLTTLDTWCRLVVSKVQLVLGVKLPLKDTVGHLSAIGSGGSQTCWEMRKDNVSVYALKGRRPKMEDRFSVMSSGDNKLGIDIYGVFDGHGGYSAAEFVEKTLFKGFFERINADLLAAGGSEAEVVDKKANYAQILSEEILAVDKQFLEIATASRDLAGTTALVALTYRSTLVVANVGDSRGVICDSRGMAIPLSFDHKPQQLKEQKRIKQAGGIVTFNGVWRVAGILATSRALGDYPLKQRKFIIADPDVLSFDLDDLKPRFMILASDGLWDAFTNEEAVAHVKGKLHEPDFGAKSLTLKAYERGSLDNITVVIVTFKTGVEKR